MSTYATILFPMNEAYAEKDGNKYISYTSPNVRMLEVDGILKSGAQSIVVEARLHKDSEWKTYQVIDVTTQTALVEFNIVIPELRVLATCNDSIKIGTLSTRDSGIV